MGQRLSRPQAAIICIDEIRKVSNKPIQYLIDSHHHFHHVAGGKPFTYAGAKIIARANIRAQ
jgi:glyoxylase-like metal-dependent hydrolase (beta-lactamase superfamily II)